MKKRPIEAAGLSVKLVRVLAKQELDLEWRGRETVLNAAAWAAATNWLNEEIFCETRSFYLYHYGMTLGELVDQCKGET
ncbi:hypothetical protein C4585_01860 [Candidatus Parcubacteria bacterium]|nr:MAG: hypothetical protein C4585_01860 [Candidatus Parcubacteria bacterium]